MDVEDSAVSLSPRKVKGQFKDKLYGKSEEAENRHFDDNLKFAQIYSDCFQDYPSDGIITDIVEGPKRFSRVFIDEMNYTYQQNRKSKAEGYHLRCNVKECTGSGIFIPATSVFRRLKSHIHKPDPNAVRKLQFLKNVKIRAENEVTTSLYTIYHEEAKRNEGITLPSYEKIKSTLRKRRSAAQSAKKSNSDADSLVTLQSSSVNTVATHYIAHKGMEIIEGLKRFSKIYIDEYGYCYHVNRKKLDGSLILRCHEDGCRGSGHYEPKNSNFTSLAKHSHYTDPQQVTTWRFLHRCKERAENETTPIKTIYAEERSRFSDYSIPSFKKIESTLQKRRKRLLRTSLQQSTEDGTVETMDVKQSQISVKVESVVETVAPSLSVAYNQSLNCYSSYSANKAQLVVTTEEPANNIYSTAGKAYVKPSFSEGTSVVGVHSENHRRKKCRRLTKKQSQKRKTDAEKRMKSERRKRKYLQPRILSDYKSKMEVMEGAKRFSKIFIDESSHMYQLNKARLDGSLILKCYESSCYGSGLYYPEEELFRRIAEHNHEPPTDLIAKCQLLNALKMRAESESKPLRTIYEEEVAKYPNVQVPNFSKIESTLQKRRRAKVPAEPKSLKEAALKFEKTEFSKCERGNYFKQYISEGDTEILVFVSPGILEERFSQAEVVHFDSSFKVIPQRFSQLLLVSIVMHDHVFPVIYAMLTGCSRTACRCFCKFLTLAYPNFSPHTIMTDCNEELESVLGSIFHGATLRGCWFYYTQAVWRSIGTVGVTQNFFQDEVAKNLLKCSMALPLLPPNRIAEGMKILQAKCCNTAFHLKETRNSLLKIMCLINKSLIERIGPEALSLYGKDRQLNYSIEAMYQLLIKKLGVHTPSLIRFTEKIFQVENAIMSEYKSKSCERKIRLDKSRLIQENESLIKDSYHKFKLNAISLQQFLEKVSKAVPRHCHNDYICELTEEEVCEDPSDIPNTLPFCEISVEAPVETSDTETDQKPLVTKLHNVFSSNSQGDISLSHAIQVDDLTIIPQGRLCQADSVIPDSTDAAAIILEPVHAKRTAAGQTHSWPHEFHIQMTYDPEILPGSHLDHSEYVTHPVIPLNNSHIVTDSQLHFPHLVGLHTDPVSLQQTCLSNALGNIHQQPNGNEHHLIIASPQQRENGSFMNTTAALQNNSMNSAHCSFSSTEEVNHASHNLHSIDKNEVYLYYTHCTKNS